MNNLRPGTPLAPFVGILCGLALAVYLGSLIGGSEVGELIGIALVALGVASLVLIRDYWWAPLVLISALTFRTNVLGFIMTGIDVGVVVLAMILPLNLAMRRLHPAEPPLKVGLAFKLLFAFVVVHAAVIILYNRYQGVPLKNIVKAYYTALAPLAFYALLFRYCKPHTVKPVTFWTFVMYAFVLAVSIPVIWMGTFIPFLNSAHFLFDWTHSGVAIGAARSYAPLLFAATLALFPVMRSAPGKLLVFLGVLLSIVGALVSASRIAILVCIVEGLIMCMLRRRFWVIAPIAALVLLLGFYITNDPGVLYNLPEPVHRALTPFNVSSQQTAVQAAAEGSNEWHEDLQRDSFVYWTSDLWAFLVGHGFKAWDESLTGDPAFTQYYEDAKRLAVQMGRPENALNSITNIFGLAGLVLYAALLIRLFRQTLSARRMHSARSFERGLCDFSITTLLAFVFFAPWAGAIPAINLIYFQLGLLAAGRLQKQHADGAVERRAAEMVPQLT